MFKPSSLGRKHIDDNMLKTAGSIFTKLVEVGASTHAKGVSLGSGGYVCFLGSTITVLSSIAFMGSDVCISGSRSVLTEYSRASPVWFSLTCPHTKIKLKLTEKQQQSVT